MCARKRRRKMSYQISFGGVIKFLLFLFSSGKPKVRAPCEMEGNLSEEHKVLFDLTAHLCTVSFSFTSQQPPGCSPRFAVPFITSHLHTIDPHVNVFIKISLCLCKRFLHKNIYSMEMWFRIFFLINLLQIKVHLAHSRPSYVLWLSSVEFSHVTSHCSRIAHLNYQS